MATSDKAATAHHEASHAVLAILLDRPFDICSIRAGVGHGRMTSPATWQMPTEAHLLEREIIIRLAGWAGESRYRNAMGESVPSVSELAKGATTTHSGFVYDGQSAFKIAEAISANPKELIEFLAELADRLINRAEVAKSIDAVACELLKEKELTSEQIKKIVQPFNLTPTPCAVRLSPSTHWKM